MPYARTLFAHQAQMQLGAAGGERQRIGESALITKRVGQLHHADRFGPFAALQGIEILQADRPRQSEPGIGHMPIIFGVELGRQSQRFAALSFGRRKVFLSFMEKGQSLQQLERCLAVAAFQLLDDVEQFSVGLDRFVKLVLVAQFSRLGQQLEGFLAFLLPLFRRQFGRRIGSRRLGALFGRGRLLRRRRQGHREKREERQESGKQP